MPELNARDPGKTEATAGEVLGHVHSVTGAQASIGLLERARAASRRRDGRKVHQDPHRQGALDRRHHRCLASGFAQHRRTAVLRRGARRSDRRDRRSRRQNRLSPRRHRLPLDRRCGERADQQRIAAGVRYVGRQDDQDRAAAAGQRHHRCHRRRRDAEQAFRGARHHRRRQVERGRRHPAADSPGAARRPHPAARRSQRVWPLLRRTGLFGQSGKPAAAVLAVQFRGDRRRLLRRPSRSRRGSRDSRRGHSAGQGHLHPIPPYDRTAGDQEAGPQEQRLYGRYAGAVSAGRPVGADRRADGKAGEPFIPAGPSQADDAHRNRQQRSALRVHVRERQCRRRHHGGIDQPAVSAARPTAGR